MKPTFEITSATVLTSKFGTDVVYLHTDLAPSVWPLKEHPSLTMTVAQGNGQEYVRTHFPGVPIQTIYRRT